MEIFNHLYKAFRSVSSYDTINKLTEKKLRRRNNGIDLDDCFFYRFSYTMKDTTQQSIVSEINQRNKTKVSRQAFEAKERSIPLKAYELLLFKVVECFHFCINLNKDLSFVAVDGVYNSDRKHVPMLNLGIFDITNNVPIDVKFVGANGRNKEVANFKKHLIENKDKYVNTVFIFDRLYFNYSFIRFLENNEFKYIIRVKGQYPKLDPENEVHKNDLQYKIITELRECTRIVKSDKTVNKIVNASKSKKKHNSSTIKIKNDCILVTNLINEYTDEELLNLYRSRWDIEVFFKLIKANFKFQNMKEKNEEQYRKLYICELIISYIVKIIEHLCMKDKKFDTTRINSGVECTVKINKSNLIKGIVKFLIPDLLKGSVNETYMKQFITSYVTIIKNEVNRSFPRISKTPFTKWYVKGYSDSTKFAKIIDAIINGTVEDLHSNLKSIAKKIKAINGKEYG
ncbi:MAG: IS4 family transposase [Dasosvirus sp.]|uniref:IS4 family transposase n=1 Tax=Dasosvirus sp. TaxID=2487764 RepID=A0A3G4ZW32_9VIRU|nr:MAG: IS4 family transposase [Dasosvirus sp.]